MLEIGLAQLNTHTHTHSRQAAGMKETVCAVDIVDTAETADSFILWWCCVSRECVRLWFDSNKALEHIITHIWSSDAVCCVLNVWRALLNETVMLLVGNVTSSFNQQRTNEKFCSTIISVRFVYAYLFFFSFYWTQSDTRLCCCLCVQRCWCIGSWQCIV